MDGSPWENSTNRVEFHGGVLEENWQKQLKPIHRPYAKSSWSNPPQTKILDLKQITHSFTLQGYIIGSPTIPAVGSTSDTIQNMFKNLIEDGGVKNMTWVDEDGTVKWKTINFTKAMTRKDPKNDDTYWVQFNAIEGENV